MQSPVSTLQIIISAEATVAAIMTGEYEEKARFVTGFSREIRVKGSGEALNLPQE